MESVLQEELRADGGGEDEAVDLHPAPEGGGEGRRDREEEGRHRGREGGSGTRAAFLAVPWLMYVRIRCSVADLLGSDSF